MGIVGVSFAVSIVAIALAAAVHRWRATNLTNLRDAKKEDAWRLELEQAVNGHAITLLGAIGIVFTLLLNLQQSSDARYAAEQEERIERRRLAGETISTAFTLLDAATNSTKRIAGIHLLSASAAVQPDTRLPIVESLGALLRLPEEPRGLPAKDCGKSGSICTSVTRASVAVSDVETIAVRTIVELREEGDPPLRLSPSMLSEASFTRADQKRAHLAHVDFHRSDLSLTHFERADVSGADFFGTNLFQADFTGAIGDSRTNFAGADMSGVDLSSPKNASTIFDGANFNGAVLHRAKLCGVSLKRARFATSHLGEAIATNADFAGADLTCATFDRAALAGATLRNVVVRDGGRPNLTGANLAGGNFDENCAPGKDSDAEVEAADADDAFLEIAFLCDTTMPDGAKSNRDCGTKLPDCDALVKTNVP